MQAVYSYTIITDKYCNLETYSWIIGQWLKLLEVATSPFQACTWLTSYKGKFLGSSAVHGTYVCIDTTSPIEDTTRPGAKQLAFWTQLAYNFRHCNWVEHPKRHKAGVRVSCFFVVFKRH